MLINNNLKHIHFHIQKTGGTTLKDVLVKCGWNTQKDINKLTGFSAHPGPKHIESIPTTYEIIKDFHTTITIRNPFEWAVSMYIASLTNENFKGINAFALPNFKNLTLEEKLKMDLSFARFLKVSYPHIKQSNYLNAKK